MSNDLQQETTSARTVKLLVVAREFQPDTGVVSLQHIAEAFAELPIIVAVPEASMDDLAPLSQALLQLEHELIFYTPPVNSEINWTVTAPEYRNAFDLLRSHPASTIMLLGPEAESISPVALRRMYDEITDTQCDLVTANYLLPARSGLVNSAILYPLSRALFGASPRFPLAMDACLSVRMLERMNTVSQRNNTPNQPSPLLWPVSEAIAAGLRVGQCDVGQRSLPQPAASGLNEMIGLVVGACFADIEAKAAVWQRLRMAPQAGRQQNADPSSPVAADEIAPLIEGFRLAYTNLRDVWTLVLPPQSLLGLKRLANAQPSGFLLPDVLWARIVYDFLLAFRLRTLNRSHLLGSLTPLYLAWLASHLTLTNQGVEPEHHVQQIAEAFEAEKAYFVARWRWPDRFNP